MIYKTISINYYPSSLGTQFNCTITDQRQTNVVNTIKNSSIFLYDIVKANNTTVENNNTVNISLSRISGNTTTLNGYKYTSNNVENSKTLNSVTSTTFKIDNFRDPGAKITIYGGGTGTITTKSTSYSETVEGGRKFTLNASYTVNIATFSYPNSNNVKVTVTPNYSGSGSGLDASNNWEHEWGVKFNGAQGSTSGTGNHGTGTFTFKCPYDTQWTVASPKIEVYCVSMRAHYKYSTSGQQIYAGFRTNQGWNSTYGWVVTGYFESGGSGGMTYVRGDEEFPDAEKDGEGYWCEDIWGDSAWVAKENGSPYYTTEPGSTYEGYIEY